ncbi:MAG: arylsulfatase [Bacteroidetes bacterium]|nr:arylsulfatase [Bacteroidota bacterium]
MTAKIIFILFVVCLVGCSSPSIINNTQIKPNIIVVMVDDMGFSDIGCYGGGIDTPNLDKLASEGLRFSTFYNCSRCCPTRASLLTGLYPHKTGIGFMTAVDYGKPGYRADLNNNCVTIAEVLKSGGYSTYMAGKWHVSRNFEEDKSKHNWPKQRGFDKFYGTIIAAGSQWDPLTLAEGNNYIEPETEDFYYTEAITDKAIQYIEGHDSEEKPFFLYVAHTAPHWPLHARDSLIQKYRGRFAAGWDTLREQRLKRLKKQGILNEITNLSKRDPAVPSWESVEQKNWEQSRFEVFAAMIDHVDQGVGRIVDLLETKGIIDNTLILFLSDNGGDMLEHPDGYIGTTGKPWAYMRYVPLFTRDGRPVIAGDIPGIKLGADNTYGGYGTKWAMLSNTPFRKFKKYTYEGGIATPLIAFWPQGIKARNELRHQPAHVIDIMATCLEVSGIDYPDFFKENEIKPLDGKSLVPMFRKDTTLHDALFWEHHGNKGIRKGKWKLVSSYDHKWELYDLEKDRSETTDCAEEHPEIVNQLALLYDDWASKSDVLSRDELQVKEIPGQENPLVRSDTEMDVYLKTVNKELKKRGLKILNNPAN